MNHAQSIGCVVIVTKTSQIALKRYKINGIASKWVQSHCNTQKGCEMPQMKLDQCVNDKIELNQYQIACTMGGIPIYDMFSADGGWSYGEIIEHANTMLIAWVHEWFGAIWVEMDQFQSYWDELDGMWTKLSELYPNGIKWDVTSWDAFDSMVYMAIQPK